MTTYAEIVQKLVQGQIYTGLGPNQRRLWPRFAYHFTDILNAVAILKDGELASRAKMIQANQMANDNASQAVISGTDPAIANFVRLYFRPKTPTQFNNEGFQTQRQRSSYNADCPIPVFFLFDLPALLADPDVRFSTKTLAAHEQVELFQGPEAFSRLPFDKIYHNHAIYVEEDKRAIVQSRQAEIVIPDQLKFQHLEHIVTRSAAEKETLRALLHAIDIYRYDELITDADADLFFKDRNYIDQVMMSDLGATIISRTNYAFPPEWGDASATGILFAQNSDQKDAYLNLTARFTLPDGSVLNWPAAEYGDAVLKDQVNLRFKHPESQYQLEIEINHHIAFRGEYVGDDDLPF